MTRMRGSWFRAVPVPAVWLTLASFRSSTLALTAVVALTPLASAQVADVLPGDQPGPYPHWITAPSDLGWDERLTRSHPELTAADMADIEGEPRRRRMADPADVEGIFRYRLVGEHRSSLTGHSISFSNDVDCDGFAEVIIGAPLVVGAGGNQFNDPKLGAVYVVSMADVEAADAADGTADGVIDLGLVAAQPRSWKLLGEGRHLVGTSVASGGDINGDGCSELLIGARAYGYFTGSAYLVSASDLPAADAADGAADGVVDIRRIADQPDSWELTGEASRDNAGRTVIFAGDVNGDGRSDLLIGALFHGNDDRGAAYLLSGAALASADAEDGAADGRIALASVAAQPDSWKLLGENAKVFAGNKLAAANLDSDGRSDLIVAALFEFSTRGAVYLIAASDLPAMDSADGQSDGVIDLGNVAGGRASWKLVGDIEGQYIGREVAAGDVDGDGVDNVVIATSNETDSGRPAEVFVISVSGLPSADAADGARDGVATLDRALEQDGSFKLVGENRLYISSDADIDGDGLDDLLVGDIDFREGSRCLPGGGSRTNGAVYLISGASLRGADASDGAEDSVIDLDRVSSQDGSWQFIGGPTDRLGGALAAGDLDGDGNNDLILAPWINHTPYHDCGSSRDAGYVFLMSGAHLPAADAVDGAADGKIHLAALGVPVDALETPIVFTQFDDSVIVARVPEFLEYNQLDDDKLIKTFLRHYEDVFDYLIIVTDLPPNSPQYDYAGIYVDLRNSVVGTGKRVSSGARVYGERLKGWIHLTYFDPSSFSQTLRHEIMHAWANFIILAGRPHWGFSSANGVLGGFDLAQLTRLGDDRYTAGNFSPVANRVHPYSAIELYLAGFIPPTEVPEIWVATDGAWSGDNDASGHRVFTASEIETWSIQRIVAEHGARTPSWVDSQRGFRAATILIVDDLAAASGKAGELSAALRGFFHPGPDGDDSSYNFWEATGGRATVKTGDLRLSQSPVRVGTLPDRRLAPDSILDVDVSPAFVEPDGDPLTYAAASTAPQVVTAVATGSRVTLTAVGIGAATVRVTAADPGGLIATQSFRVTVTATVPFTDDPIAPAVTPVKAIHFTELRTRIDVLRRAAGLALFPWTDAILTPGVTTVRLAHLLDLREALAAAYAGGGRSAPSWSDAAPTAGSTPIKAVHLMELRAAVVALE